MSVSVSVSVSVSDCLFVSHCCGGLQGKRGGGALAEAAVVAIGNIAQSLPSPPPPQDREEEEEKGKAKLEEEEKEEEEKAEEEKEEEGVGESAQVEGSASAKEERNKAPLYTRALAMVFETAHFRVFEMNLSAGDAICTAIAGRLSVRGHNYLRDEIITPLIAPSTIQPVGEQVSEQVGEPVDERAQAVDAGQQEEAALMQRLASGLDVILEDKSSDRSAAVRHAAGVWLVGICRNCADASGERIVFSFFLGAGGWGGDNQPGEVFVCQCLWVACNAFDARTCAPSVCVCVYVCVCGSLTHGCCLLEQRCRSDWNGCSAASLICCPMAT